jgi:hypothetical protein
MYNLVILHDLLNGGNNWGSFYTYELQVTPNFGFHLIAYPLLHFFSPQIVEKLFVSIYIILMGVSVPVFLKTFAKQVFPFAYMVFPVLFNFCILMGFYSFVVTVPLFLLALSLSWKVRNSPLPLKIFSLNAAGIILFYFHLIPAVLYMMSLMIMAVSESSPIKNKIKNIAKLLAITIPSVLNLFLYFFHTSFFSSVHGSFANTPPVVLFSDLLTFSMFSYSYLSIIPISFLLFLYLRSLSVFFHFSIKNRSAGSCWFSCFSTKEKFLVLLASTMICIYFLAPFQLGEGSHFNQRFPWVIYLITLPLLCFPEKVMSKRLCSVVVAGVAALFLVCNVVILWQQSVIIQNFMSAKNVPLPKGSLIMLLKTINSRRSPVDALMHASSHYGIIKGCVDIGNYEAATDLFPVRYKDCLPALPPQSAIVNHYETIETIKFEKYPSIHYLLAWQADANNRKDLNHFYHVIWEKESLSIWQRNTTSDQKRGLVTD